MTTIQVKRDIMDRLKELKRYSRETYNDLIARLIDFYQRYRKNNQYDEFLHKIQQPKMNELWDNEEDEAWENA
ncbi:MAG: DUF7557 family protein [Candidatus Ranarchaeia archaeon]